MNLISFVIWLNHFGVQSLLFEPGYGRRAFIDGMHLEADIIDYHDRRKTL